MMLENIAQLSDRKSLRCRMEYCRGTGSTTSVFGIVRLIPSSGIMESCKQLDHSRIGASLEGVAYSLGSLVLELILH